MKQKEKAHQEINQTRNLLENLALEILHHPELGYQEFFASSQLASVLESANFKIEMPYKGLPTAFKAAYKHGNGPKIAFLAEYDALAGVGHGCGHNLIGPAAVGAALGMKAGLDELEAEIIVIGTPAEEYMGEEEGKIKLVAARAFDDLDVCFITHPYWANQVLGKDLGFIACEIHFYGKPAHASADPWNGINALDAMIATFNNINALRQQLPPEARVHGIITDGGQAPNIIPEHTSASFMIRTEDPKSLEEIYQRIIACANAGALSSGAKVEVKRLTTVLNTRKNLTLNQIILNNFSLLQESVIEEPRTMIASSDFGNVSQVVPSVLFFTNSHTENIPWHTTSVAAESGTSKALQSMITAASVMAFSAIDLIVDNSLLAQVKKDFLDDPRPK